MKTGQHWLESLPDWIQELAIVEIDKFKAGDTMSKTYSSLSAWLSNAFLWSETPQDYTFWSEVAGYGTTMSKDYFKSIKNKYTK